MIVQVLKLKGKFKSYACLIQIRQYNEQSQVLACTGVTTVGHSSEQPAHKY